jgi:hypothetical protein
MLYITSGAHARCGGRYPVIKVLANALLLIVFIYDENYFTDSENIFRCMINC